MLEEIDGETVWTVGEEVEVYDGLDGNEKDGGKLRVDGGK